MDPDGQEAVPPPMVSDLENWLLVSSDSSKRFTSSTYAVIVWVPFGMVYAPPSVPMVTDAPAASGALDTVPGSPDSVHRVSDANGYA